jgi:hypothetical protein
VIVKGHSVMDVASREVSRQAVHGWLRRYEDDGLDGLKDPSGGQGGAAFVLITCSGHATLTAEHPPSLEERGGLPAATRAHLLQVPVRVAPLHPVVTSHQTAEVAGHVMSVFPAQTVAPDPL